MLRRLLLLALLCYPVAFAQQPVVNALVSAAGEVTEVSPGGIGTVWGLNFASEVEAATALPLPRKLGVTRVLINGVECPLFYVSEFQINLQVPFETPTGIEVVVQVERDGVLSEEFLVVVQPDAISVFMYERIPQSGVLEPIVLHSDGVTLVTPDNPAKTNEIVVIYATGSPQLINPPLTGMGAPFPPNDSLTVALPSALLNTNRAGFGLSVHYSGLAAGFVGLWQLNIRLAASIPEGDGLGVRIDAGDSVQKIFFPIVEE